MRPPCPATQPAEPQALRTSPRDGRRQQQTVRVRGAHVPHHDLGMRARAAVLAPRMRVSEAVPPGQPLQLRAVPVRTRIRGGWIADVPSGFGHGLLKTVQLAEAGGSVSTTLGLDTGSWHYRSPTDPVRQGSRLARSSHVVRCDGCGSPSPDPACASPTRWRRDGAAR